MKSIIKNKIIDRRSLSDKIYNDIFEYNRNKALEVKKSIEKHMDNEHMAIND